MYNKIFFKILLIFFIPLKIIAYDFSYQTEDILLELDFDNKKIKEIKFDIEINGQRNFGIINYHNNEIYILLNTDQISFDNFKKVFPKADFIKNGQYLVDTSCASIPSSNYIL